ncbi:MAG: penicillin-binding protein 2 [Lachnoclostridium sp.]|nr:penicillin-binding protein 2 [Lachnospira sp.]MCM1247129.1 penicillin-binding protein 2 [Lachnoclostridium sp.]
MKEKNKKKFNIKMQKKLVVLFLVVLLAFGGLSARLVLIAREDGTRYQKQVFAQQYYDSTTIPFRRGDIVDSKGTKLATSIKVYNVIIDASVMTYNDGKYVEPTLKALETYFPQLDMTVIRSHVTNNPDSQWYIALKRLTYDEISGFQMAQAENQNIKGVWFQEEYKRTYPDGTLAPDVIGFMRADNQGQYGLEEYYNDILNGTNGREYGYLNDDTTLQRTIKPAVDGYTIHTTIDANLQSIVVKYLRQFNEEHKDAVKEGNGAENVACIMMEVNTGRILAMASYPDFDLNNPRDPQAMIGSNMVESVTNQNGYQEIRKTDTIINQEVIDGMDEDQLYLNLNNLWKNYCISCTYEPGSTAKPFTVAAALESGTITGNETYVCNGILEVGGHEIKCNSFQKGGDGLVSVQNSIAWSCNVALMKIGESLGQNKFSEFQQIFNFGLKTNIDLAGEARTNSLIVDAEIMRAADLATNSFGQNFNVTMIQLITGYCSLINGGYYYEPHMVDKISNANGATIQNIEPRILKQTVSESTSELIRQYCRETVMGESGTGKAARPAGYAIGGKTGTAETLPRKNKKYVVSFIGYAPADDPQIAIYVVVDRANADRQDRSSYASGIVKNILTEALPYLNIFMTEELSEAEIKDLEERQIAITNMYTPIPEEGAQSEPQDTENTNPPDNVGEASGFTDPTGETGASQPVWKTYPIDPATGYRKNPQTGEMFYAETGEPVSGDSSSFSGDVQANPNLPQGQLAE